METVGVDLEQIDRTEDLYRKRDRERLKIQLEVGDLREARDRVLAETGGFTLHPETDAERAAETRLRDSDCG